MTAYHVCNKLYWSSKCPRYQEQQRVTALQKQEVIIVLSTVHIYVSADT